MAVGTGTIAVEITEEVRRGDLQRPDVVLVPVGDGARISGIGP
jgi:threonine dehydratase